MRKSWKLLLLSLFIAASLGAQDNTLQNTVTQTQLGDNVNRSDVVFGPLTASITADTTEWFSPYKWNSVLMKFSGTFNSKAVQAQAWCGRKYSDTLSITAKCDSLDVTVPGTYLWQLNIPVARMVHVVFSSATTVTSVQVDSVTVFRNW